MSDRAAEARAEAERQGWVNFERAAFRMGVVWADANPKPRAITHDDIGAAYAVFMDAEGHPVTRFIVALKAIGIEVEGR